MLDGVVNKASAVFVCCARSDALNHARVLRSELSIRLNRGCAVGGGPNTVQWIEQSEAVVVVLTTALVTDPDALFEIWTALSHDIPIITVAVAGEYNFAQAGRKFSNLPHAMQSLTLTRQSWGLDFFDSQRSQRSQRSEQQSQQMDEAAARLNARLPNGADVLSIGKTIHDSLTAIIAISWTPHYGRNHMDAIVNTIMARMQDRRVRAGKGDQLPGRSRGGRFGVRLAAAVAELQSD